MAGDTWTLREYVAHSSEVSCLSLGRRSGQLIATGGKDKKVNLWSLLKPNCLMTLSGFENPIECVRFNGAEVKVGVGSVLTSGNGIFKIWDLEEAKLVNEFKNHKSTVNAIEFYKLGEFAASGAIDGNIKMLDLRRKGCIHTYKTHDSETCCIRFSPDGRWLAAAFANGTIRIWNIGDNVEIACLQEHKCRVNIIEFHQSELLMASADDEGKLIIWDLDKKCILNDFILNERLPIKSLAFDENEMCVYAISGSIFQAFSWDPLTCLTTIPLPYKNISDAICNNGQMVGASFIQSNVITFVVDTKKINKTSKDVDNIGRKTFMGGVLPTHIEKESKKDVKLSESNNDNIEDDNCVEVKDKEFLKNFACGDKIEAFKSPNDQKKTYIADKGNLNENDVLKEVRLSHSEFMSKLGNRHRNLHVVKAEWFSKGIKDAMDVAVCLREHSVIVDLLHILLSDVSFWNLDIAQILLPILYDLLCSKDVEYVHISLSTLRLIGHTFGQMIKINVANPPRSHEIDLAKQQRYNKCSSCHKSLAKILGQLTKMKSKMPEGRLGDKILEMHSLLSL